MSSMQEHVVPFQPRRFEGAAPHYLQGRPPYAGALFRRVAEITGLSLRHRVLDLGCGPGQIATGFAGFAGAVIAMDPEPEMLAIGAARIEGTITNVTFVQGSSYDLSAAAGQFHLVTIGRAFHWMDREDTLRRLDTLTTPDASVALFSDLHPDVPENAWLKQYRAIRKRHTGQDQPAWRQPGWPSHERFLLASPFCRLERIGILERRRIPAARLVDRVLSMSTSSRTQLGPQVEVLAREMREYAESIATDGMIEEVVETTALLATRAV
jgi:SAM-dependent methyltransferase